MNRGGILVSLVDAVKKLILKFLLECLCGFKEINVKLDKIMSAQSDLALKIKSLTAKVEASTAELQKIGTETGNTLALVTSLQAQIVALQGQIAQGADLSEVSAAVDAMVPAVDALVTQAKATDDLVPDAPVTPPVTGDVPVISGPQVATATVGAPVSIQVNATNSPTSYGASGLPGRLNIDPVTGLITGIPESAGDSTVTLNAANAAGKAVPATLALSVVAA